MVPTRFGFPSNIAAMESKLFIPVEKKRTLNFYFILYSIDTHLTHQQQSAFENIVGKGEIARNEQFLLFPQCFLPKQITVSPFVHIVGIISLFAAELEEARIAI